MTLSTDVVNLLLDADGDIDLSSGDLELNGGLDGVAQDLASAVQAIKGEWFLDLELGIPLFPRDGVVTDADAIMGQRFRAGYTRDQFAAALLAVPNVTDLISLSVDFNAATRRMSVAWKVRCTFGDTEGATEF